MSDDHKCFGCQKQIADHEPHIHVGLNEWGSSEGLGSLGSDAELDELLTFAFCRACTDESKHGRYHLEAHEMEGRA